MSMVDVAPKSGLEELEECISRAMQRVNAQKEAELCHYLPGKNGRLHHFAFGKMKKTQPLELLTMIREHILEKDTPQTVSSAPRPGLKVKRQVEVKLKRSQINRLVDILKEAGEEELISVLAPHQTLTQVQKLMLEMVREKEVDQGLWETYARLVEEEKAIIQ